MTLRLKWTKIALFVLCLVPLGRLGWRGYQGDLTANPIEYITHETGLWTLRLVCVTLAVTPLRRILGKPELIRYRRMLGLFAFFYGVLHLTTWLWLDKFFDLHDMVADVLKRRFITVGMLGFALMVPLAVTSTTGWIRRLGGRRWQVLHRLIYGTALAGVVHYWWLVKSDITRPAMYGTIVALLLGYRIWSRYGRAKPAPVGVKLSGSRI